MLLHDIFLPHKELSCRNAESPESKAWLEIPKALGVFLESPHTLALLQAHGTDNQVISQAGKSQAISIISR